jgi:hypothetical protein
MFSIKKQFKDQRTSFDAKPIRNLKSKIQNRFVVFIFLSLVLTLNGAAQSLKISENRRFFAQRGGKPFFWLGDTGWLLFVKCSREETLEYLETRRRQGFNVVQIMILHDLKKSENFYGDAPVAGLDIAKPLVTNGKNYQNADEYDYWDHVEWVTDEAARRGIFTALVPIWGSNVKSGAVSEPQAKAYAEFLAERFRDKPNIIWLNGGDIRGDGYEKIWKTIGSTLRRHDPNHLIGFHPRGRTMSSEWFHDEAWLDFNLFQSGHRNYEQDNSPDEKHHFGEDNWRYALNDYALRPVKPTLDGEPSYENIPQGLHDPKQPRWTAADIRRYAYWSVFAGGAGFTYGENSVMQFYKKGDREPAYGAEKYWPETINAAGAGQMRFLKKLILSKPYFERVPADEIIVNQGARYDRLAAARGENYAFIYTYTGRRIDLKMGFLKGRTVKFSWYDPREGHYLKIGKIPNDGFPSFDPPGAEKAGNDWILVLEN